MPQSGNRTLHVFPTLHSLHGADVQVTPLVYIDTQQEWVLEDRSTRLIRIFQQDGWVHASTKGSHWQFTHPTKPGRVTIPHPNKDIPHGTVASVYRQAGWNA